MSNNAYGLWSSIPFKSHEAQICRINAEPITEAEEEGIKITAMVPYLIDRKEQFKENDIIASDKQDNVMPNEQSLKPITKAEFKKWSYESSLQSKATMPAVPKSLTRHLCGPPAKKLKRSVPPTAGPQPAKLIHGSDWRIHDQA